MKIRGAILAVLCMPAAAFAQQMGSLRGAVYDRDFNAPIPQAQIQILETNDKALTADDGNFVFPAVRPGVYTVIVAKDGYSRQVTTNVAVYPAQLAEVTAYLSGVFTEMEEYVVQDVQIGGTEAGLLALRVESPALLDSVGADLISRAGAGDAASALKLVAGASVQDGKYAVIRGLPDRYVTSQMNSARLPTADADKRAVQLDQFPAGIIDSIQVSKTFTPDQQADASGGAVNLVLKGIPSEATISAKAGITVNTQTTGNENFLTYRGGGVNAVAKDRDTRALPRIPGPADDDQSQPEWSGAVGVTRYRDLTAQNLPPNYSVSVAAGGTGAITDKVKIGGLASVYYKHDRSYAKNGIDDSYWVTAPGQPLSPRSEQGEPSGAEPEDADFKTSLFDVTKGSQSVSWGGLVTAGVEIEQHRISVLHLYTRDAEDTAALFEDTRGKAYYFPGYAPDYLFEPGNKYLNTAPYLRLETLQYTERTTHSTQISGRHRFELADADSAYPFTPQALEADWTMARSESDLYQPDKRQFGSLWNPATPPVTVGEYTFPGTPATHYAFKPAANFNLGNVQRIWRYIAEGSEQHFANLSVPFSQWAGEPGFVKTGFFRDEVRRVYNQDSFSNAADQNSSFPGEWEVFWSEAFPDEEHPMGEAFIDVDYRARQDLAAWYYMLEVPLTPAVQVMGGARHELTRLSIVNEPEKDVIWIPPGKSTDTKLLPGDADVDFEQNDILPAYGLNVDILESLTLRLSRSDTIARQTFKELTPIQQMEYLGADVFIGNPFLTMSALKNYDARLDYTPYAGGLISFSWFLKKIKNPIEYVQRRTTSFGFTTAVNYPRGRLEGYEVEARQQLGRFFDGLQGWGVGGNATLIDAQVWLPEAESEAFRRPHIDLELTSRDMSHAPEYLYNFFLTYDNDDWGTKFGIFYTIKGDTLVAGAGYASGSFIPNVYETAHGSLSVSLGQQFGKRAFWELQVKNILNPAVQTVYRADRLDGDTVKTSYTRGIDYALSCRVEW